MMIDRHISVSNKDIDKQKKKKLTSYIYVLAV